jgi:hypothetical protein
MKQLDISVLTAELVIENMPLASGGTRKDFDTEVTQVVMKMAVDGTLDKTTLAA